MADVAIECLAWLVNPVQEPVSDIFLVSTRVSSILCLFASMILWILACIFTPWKYAIYKGDVMEIGVWRICRITPKFFQCYDGWYENHFKWWFVFYRYLQVIGIAAQLLTITFLVVESVRRRDGHAKPWMMGFIGSLFSASCYFTVLVLFYLKFEWEITESNFGWMIMGWNEETPDTDDFIETTGYCYIMAWVGLIVDFISVYLFYYAKCAEKVWINSRKKKAQLKEMLKLKREAQEMMKGTTFESRT